MSPAVEPHVYRKWFPVLPTYFHAVFKLASLLFLIYLSTHMYQDGLGCVKNHVLVLQLYTKHNEKILGNDSGEVHVSTVRNLEFSGDSCLTRSFCHKAETHTFHPPTIRVRARAMETWAAEVHKALPSSRKTTPTLGWFRYLDTFRVAFETWNLQKHNRKKKSLPCRQYMAKTLYERPLQKLGRSVKLDKFLA